MKNIVNKSIIKSKVLLEYTKNINEDIVFVTWNIALLMSLKKYVYYAGG